MMTQTTQQARGTCPVCNGTTRRSAEGVQSAHVLVGYDAATRTLPCRNCGGQYQYGSPTGQVALNREAQPCRHSYIGDDIGRCFTRYVCQHCGDSYAIDSGD